MNGVETGGEHEEMIARMADHPEQIIFVESIYLAHVAEAASAPWISMRLRLARAPGILDLRNDKSH
jgi:hypothetical protein